MYRMSILTLLAPEPLRSKLDVPRCTLLALVHDMGESLVGDITPMDRVPKPEKHRREAEAMGFLTTGIRRHHQSKSVEEAPRGAEVDGVDGSSSQLPPSEANNGHSFPLSHGLLGAGTGCEVAGEMLRSAWDEYEADETLEAHFVHDVDKLELVLQMMEYERRGNGKVDLGEFVWVAEGLRLEEMKAWCREVLREREQFWIERGKEGVTGRDVAKRVLSEEGR
ncbi:MAG: hypothetical protein LQ342_003022 [Letrouitia transgressa]|nr:MAG: hypothetical protein LQ342_003022 [Letrouitia transgressa]